MIVPVLLSAVLKSDVDVLRWLVCKSSLCFLPCPSAVGTGVLRLAEMAIEKILVSDLCEL